MLTRGAQVTGVASAALCLTWISGIGRVYVRVRLQKFFGTEDWLILASTALLTVLCGLLLEAVTYGLGAHYYAIPTDWLETLAKYIFACELLYSLTMAVVKISIGLYLLRLSGRRYQKIIIYATLAVVVLYSLMYFLFLILQCRPVAFLWNQFYTDDGTCVSHATLANVTYSHAAISAMTDWILGVLPITFVWKMRMNPRTKFSVIFILCLGFFASTATIVRIVYIHSLQDTDDYTWEGINLAKWSLVEPAIGLTAANIATLRPLFQNFLHRSRTTPAATGKRREGVDSTYSDDSDSNMMARAMRDPVMREASQDKGYSRDFAFLMGLETNIGVTTTITVGSQRNSTSTQHDSDSRAWKFGKRKTAMRESTAQLPDINELKVVRQVAPSHWTEGIQTTQVVTMTTG